MSMDKMELAKEAVRRAEAAGAEYAGHSDMPSGRRRRSTCCSSSSIATAVETLSGHGEQ